VKRIYLIIQQRWTRLKADDGMKKLLLTLMLAVMSSSAMAEWVRVDYNSDKGVTTYVNFFTILKSGDTIKMWDLRDYKKGQELAFLPLYMSVKRQSEFNCKEKQIKRLYVSYHAKNMGKGKVIYSDKNPEDWSTVSPDSIDKELWELACRK
jgi:hypothetical protein